MKTDLISLTTSDGVHLAGVASYPATAAQGGVLLIHMLPATKESWVSWHGPLNEIGYLTLAIDLRGHGASQEQKSHRLDYRTFSEKDHQTSYLDITASLDWLTRELDSQAPYLGIIGASIGANLALAALASDPQFSWAVLLSPGRNYHGLETAPVLPKLRPQQHLLLLASEEDTEAVSTVAALAKERPTDTTARILTGLGHGTTMAERQPNLISDIVKWINTLACS